MSEYDETFQENISALLDGELSEQKARALRACIDTSEEPRAVFQVFSAVEGALSDAFPEVPAGLHEHILSGVRAAASQKTFRTQRQEADAPRQTERRRSLPRRSRMALIAAACLVLVITGAALSGRFFRMGRSGAGSNAAADSLSGSSQAADAGGVENGVAFDTTAAEEETADEAPAEGAPSADAPAAKDALERLEGLVSFAVFVDNESYEGADAAAAVDEFFDSEPTDRVLNLSIAFSGEAVYSVQLWYRGGKAVCSLNEDGLEVRSLEEILAYFRG